MEWYGTPQYVQLEVLYFGVRPYRMIRLRHRHFLHFLPAFFGWYVPRYGCRNLAIATVPLQNAHLWPSNYAHPGRRDVHVGYLRSKKLGCVEAFGRGIGCSLA